VSTLPVVQSIAAAAEAADGVAPLDEATLLTLRHHPDSVRSWVRKDGFVLLTDTAPGGPKELSLVVRPAARGHGHGRALLEEALAAADGEIRAWSHGDHPAAGVLAHRHGFDRARELWVMRRSMAEPLPAPPDPRDLVVRGYRPADADELLRVNAAAFAHHPEQSGMDAANLAERMAEPWFDPGGLLVAADGDRLLGFHWTKRHSPVLGEVYVLGIDPAAQGRGLGKLLTLAGLHHLADAGVVEVHLYVEADNAPAIAVYSGLGFRHDAADTHVMYRRW
jgi:mycothiol synthase